MKEKWEGPVSFALITFLLVMACIGWAKYVDEKREAERIQENFRSLTDDRNFVQNEWTNCRRVKDQYKSDLDAMLVCGGAVTRIEYLEGQLDSCTRAYAEERHDRKFYQNALENVSPYCSEGLDDLVIEGLRAELDACTHQTGLLQHGLFDALNDRRICKEELKGAPCHSHHDGLHCSWEPCTMLYDCAFGELGWIGPDRVMCDEFGNTRYNEARAVCYSDRNCSSCIEMTGGNLGHCYAFAYYP